MSRRDGVVTFAPQAASYQPGNSEMNAKKRKILR